MPTLPAYVQALGHALDDLAVYAAASGSASTVVISALISAASNASTGRYDGTWVFNATKGLQRRVRSGGYAASTGTVTVDPTWTSPSSSDVIEITTLFPVIEQVLSDETSYRRLVNRALGFLLIGRDEVTAAVTTADQYAVGTTYPWLDRPERLVSVLEPNPISGRSPVDSMWRGWELIPDGDASKLRTKVPFDTATGNLTLVTNRPASTWIKVGGTWGESTVGLVNETDEAAPDANSVVAVALREAYLDLMGRGATAPAGKWADKYADQRTWVQQHVRNYDWTQDKPEPPAAAPAPSRAA